MGLVKNAKDYLIKSLGGSTTNLTEQQRTSIFAALGGFISLNFSNNQSIQINQGYSQNVDVYAIIKKVTDVSKSIPWIVEKKQSNGNWKQLNDTTIHELMDKPNTAKSYTWDDIEEQVLLYLLITGNSYLVGNTQFNSTLIEEVDILPSQAVTITNKNSSFFIPNLQYNFAFDASQGIYYKESIKHIKFFNPNLQNHYYGLSPIQVAANVVQVGNERWIADASILGNKGISGMITDSSERPMTPEETKLLGETLRQRIGGAEKFGMVLPTNKKLDFIPIGMSSADMQLLEKGVVTTRTLCNILGLDSSLFNDPENKTYNNRLEAEKAMYTNCIIPLSNKLSEAYTQFICKNHFPNDTVRMRQDFSSVQCLQENMKEKNDILTNLVKTGIITPNEAREQLNFTKIDAENANNLQNMQQSQNNLQNMQN